LRKTAARAANDSSKQLETAEKKLAGLQSQLKVGVMPSGRRAGGLRAERATRLDWRPMGAAIGAGAGILAGIIRSVFFENPQWKAHDDSKSVYGVDIPWN
jgi:hypothetical protein